MTSYLWKIVYLIPVPLLSVSLFISICCFRNETVGYLVSKGKKIPAKKALKQIYMGESKDEYEQRYQDLADQVVGEQPEEEEAKEGGEYEPCTY